MMNLSTYPPSLIHETLAIVGVVLRKYISEQDLTQSRNPTCIFDELEQLQQVMIVMQNALFAHRQEINNQIKQSTTTMVTTRSQAISLKETLQLNLAMLERAECKVTRFSDQEIVTTIIKNFSDYMREVDFPNLTEKIELSSLLVSFRKDQEQGQDIDLDYFLNQIIDVFKHDDAVDDTIHAALMAYGRPHEEQRPEPRDRNGSGGAQPNRNTHHVETASPPTSDHETKVMAMVLKALNDLKSDMGTVKKVLNISDGTKSGDTGNPKQKKGYRVSEQREKTRSRFAGAIAKGPKVKRTSSAPQPLTARKVTITQSDSDSEQSASFAGIQRQYKPVVFDYRLLSADHNINALGEKCLRSFYGKPQHASAGNETGYPGFNSRHIDWTIRTPESSRSSSTISSLYDGFGQRISMSEIGGQDEVIDTTNDKERIQTIEEERSSPMETDQPNVTHIKEPSAAKERQQMDQSPPPRAAAPIAPCPMGTPAATVSSPSPPSMGPCLFSPSAPQVEDYALDAVPIPSILVQETLMMDKQDGSAPQDARPRTRSIARVERLVIPSSLEISDSEEEHFGQAHAGIFVPRPFGASTSVAAAKKVTRTARRRLLSPSQSSNYSPARGVRTTRSTSARTSTSSSKEERSTSTYPPYINSAPQDGSEDEDSDTYGAGPPTLVESSSDCGDM